MAASKKETEQVLRPHLFEIPRLCHVSREETSASAQFGAFVSVAAAWIMELGQNVNLPLYNFRRVIGIANQLSVV